MCINFIDNNDLSSHWFLWLNTYTNTCIEKNARVKAIAKIMHHTWVRWRLTARTACLSEQELMALACYSALDNFDDNTKKNQKPIHV